MRAHRASPRAARGGACALFAIRSYRPVSRVQTPPTPGRAAGSNPAGRFERRARTPEPDGWDIVEDLAPLRTEVRAERTGRAITRNDSPDLGFDRSVVPYRGCEHGCIYCYARPTHDFLGMSPGLDFESRLVMRPGLADALERELARPGYRPAPIALGTVSDPYQPLEREAGITRAVLEVLERFGHPVVLVTRGALVERDLDVIGRMAARRLVRVGVSVPTLDAALSRAMEPRAPAPKRRLRTIRALADAGVPVRVAVSPVIPALTDHETEAILAAAAEAGADMASCIPLRLPREVAPLFRAWLAEHRPDRAARVMNRVREMQGGRDYDPAFGTRMTGQGVWAALLRRRFETARVRLGLRAEADDLDCTQFAVPPRPGDQLALF